MCGPKSEISVVLGDAVQRYGIEAMIRSNAKDTAVSSFAAGEDAVSRLEGSSRQLVVLAADEAEERWPDGVLSGLAARGVRLLVLVDGADDEDVARSARLGGHGYVDRQDLNAHILSAAVTDILGDKLFVSATLARALLGRAGRARRSFPEGRGAALTPRELQVLHLLVQGLSNKQVARQLVISEHGVKRLVSNVLAKLNCPNRTMAVVRAMEEGILAS
ncbi:response regulator transcription factor [Streptomyces otsuchiensis]|uniref:response regulator transcription factor n=1 Tax=Streptomyces otsuchiensis TaxID=2681388 RepID=UPI001D130F64|nr:response regulator transcription factor [Streptomyces otsuchiensis]